MIRVIKRDGEWVALTAAGADPPKGLVVVASVTDAGLTIEGGLPPDELHITLGYYGDAEDADPALIESLRGWVDGTSLAGATARVGGVARMGNDDPQAVTLLVESSELADLRASLEQVAQPDMTHPHFTPHVTIGYGVPMPDTVPAEVQLGGVELWVAGEHYVGGETDAVA